MAITPTEPKQNRDINSLVSYVADRVRQVIVAMESRGYDPFVVEARRTYGRQVYLYGIGRWHHLKQRVVTHTLASKHIPGKAVDIASRSKGWNSSAFFDALWQEAKRVGLHHLGIWDRAHLEWRG